MLRAPVLFALLAAAAAAVSAVAAAVWSPAVAVALALLAGAFAMLSAAASRRLVISHGEIESAAEQVLAGDLAARAPSTADTAVDAFNRMSAHVQEVVEDARRERRRLEAALNGIADAVVAVDPQLTVVFANSAARETFGEDVEGNPFVWMLPDEAVLDDLRSSSSSDAPKSRVTERPGKRYLLVTSTPIVEGGDWAALAVFHDLTEIRRVEQMRRDFVANVSHELRTPLAALKSVIETLRGGALNDENAAEDFLERAEGEVGRLIRMVEQLLELSRIESGEERLARERVDLGVVIEEAVRRLRPQAERAEVALEFDLDERLPLVLGDEDHLERVVINLVYNALKFTPSGGRVKVWAGPVNGFARVQVADTGPGILPEDLPRIFERFYKADRSRKDGGSGLGLAVARHAVEVHGGTITAESQPGKGATFTVMLPGIDDSALDQK
jgi:two-component system phosphate regulon sensor histidine kinase PhoR